MRQREKSTSLTCQGARHQLSFQAHFDISSTAGVPRNLPIAVTTPPPKSKKSETSKCSQEGTWTLELNYSFSYRASRRMLTHSELLLSVKQLGSPAFWSMVLGGFHAYCWPLNALKVRGADTPPTGKYLHNCSLSLKIKGIHKWLTQR